jgi:hypothetical protein
MMPQTNDLQLWWELNLIGVPEPMRISPKQAQIVAEAMAKDKGGHVMLGRSIVAISAIRRLTETSDVMTGYDEQKLIGNGETDLKKPEALLDPITGAVLWRWGKRLVAKRKWDSHYSKQMGYYLLDEGGINGVWIAFIRIKYDSEPVDHNVYDCTPEESALLDKKRG